MLGNLVKGGRSITSGPDGPVPEMYLLNKIPIFMSRLISCKAHPGNLHSTFSRIFWNYSTRRRAAFSIRPLADLAIKIENIISVSLIIWNIIDPSWPPAAPSHIRPIVLHAAMRSNRLLFVKRRHLRIVILTALFLHCGIKMIFLENLSVTYRRSLVSVLINFIAKSVRHACNG